LVYGRGLTAEAAAPEAAPVVGEDPTTLVGAAFEVPLAVVEAQTNLGQVYFNRLFATAGARAAGVPGGPWASSVRGTLGAVVSLNQGMANLQLAPQVWGAWRFQDPGAWWGLGLSLDW